MDFFKCFLWFLLSPPSIPFPAFCLQYSTPFMLSSFYSVPLFLRITLPVAFLVPQLVQILWVEHTELEIKSKCPHMENMLHLVFFEWRTSLNKNVSSSSHFPKKLHCPIFLYRWIKSHCDFCLLNLYSATLLKVLISSTHLPVGTWGYLNRTFSCKWQFFLWLCGNIKIKI